jgi:hypothetical protein
VLETNIVVIHDQIPHISLPSSSFLPSRPHARHDLLARDDKNRAAVLFLLRLYVIVFYIISTKVQTNWTKKELLFASQQQHRITAIIRSQTRRITREYKRDRDRKGK